MARRRLIEIDAWNIAGAAIVTVRIGDIGFNTLPTDTPANTNFIPALMGRPTFKQVLFSDGTTIGRSGSSGGAIDINNADGTFDYLLTDYDLTRREIRIYSLPDDATSFAQAVLIQSGVITEPEHQWGVLRLNLSSFMEVYNRDIQTTLYLGTNSGAVGVEGLANDIKGTPKPLCYGECLNVRAVPVNTSGLIYQVHDGAISSVDAVYDQGAALTFNANRADLAALVAGAPGASKFDTCTSLGLFKLGSSPNGIITADVKGDATLTGYVNTVSDIAKRIALGKGGLASGDLNAASFTALNTANSSKVGLYIDQPASITSVMDLLLQSVGGWWIFGRDGTLYVGRLESPTGTAVLSLTDREWIGNPQRVYQSDQDRGVPTTKVILEYGANFNVMQGGDVAGAVTIAQREFLALPFRQVSDEDTAIATNYAGARTLQIRTYLCTSANATTEATRQLTMRKVRKERIKLKVDSELTETLALHDVVTLTDTRYDWDTGKKFRALGIDDQGAVTELDLWG